MTDRISDDDLRQWIHDLEKADFRAYPGKAAQHSALCELRDLRAERDALRKALVRAKGDFIYVKAYVTPETYLEKQLQSAIDDCKAALAAQERKPT